MNMSHACCLTSYHRQNYYRTRQLCTNCSAKLYTASYVFVQSVVTCLGVTA